MKIHKQLFHIMVAGTMALFVTSCQSNDANVRPPATVSTIDNTHPRAKLVVGSESLLDHIGIGEPRFRSLGQLTQAQVMVQNLTDARYTLEYKFDWENAQGFNVGGINTWHRFTLTPRETKTFTSMGKVPDAANIVFTVRLPDDIFIESDKRKQNRSVNDNNDSTGE